MKADTKVATDALGSPQVKYSRSKHNAPVQEEEIEDLEELYLAGWRLSMVNFSLCLGTFLMALDVNIIGVAVPKIATVFKSLDDVGWYGSAYLLTVTSFQPTFGKFFKLFDIRLTYLFVILIFEGTVFS